MNVPLALKPSGTMAPTIVRRHVLEDLPGTAGRLRPPHTVPV